MRLSELITIYLAAAAPVGVLHFMRERTRRARRAGALLKAAGVALVWPLSVFALWLERAGAATASGLDDGREARVEQAKRALCSSLHAVEDVLAEAGASGGEAVRRALRAARDCAERYVGLSLALEGADADGEPSARELELCRVAGRTGDDLLLAGRCIHRANVARLNTHLAHARNELLHALADVCDLNTRTDARRPHGDADASAAAAGVRDSSGLAGAGGSSSASEVSAALRLSRATLRLCVRAVELFSVLEDERAAWGAARLLDAECARLDRLEAAEAKARGAGAAEGELCTTANEPTTLRRGRHAPLLPLRTPTTSARG